MKLQNDTVLITGGSSGIGLELGKVLVKKGNKVIICGKLGEKLESAKQQEPKFFTYQCDLSDSKPWIPHGIREIRPKLQ